MAQPQPLLEPPEPPDPGQEPRHQEPTPLPRPDGDDGADHDEHDDDDDDDDDDVEFENPRFWLWGKFSGRNCSCKTVPASHLLKPIAYL